MNTEYGNWYLAKSPIHGVGVFAYNPLQPNAFIETAIDEQRNITFFGSKINHSWSPNSRLIYNTASKTYDLYAIVHIPQGTEITADYTYTPDFIKKPSLNWN